MEVILTARPETSNYGKAITLDSNTNHGEQIHSRPNDGGSQIYQLSYKNVYKLGFIQMVRSEAWHPSTSNHGRGIALDLNTNCEKQTRAKPECGGSKVCQWLNNNAG